MAEPRRTFFWRVPIAVWDDFMEMAERLEVLDVHDDEACAIREDIRCLPGHPRDTTDGDLIVPILTSVTVQNTVTLH